MDYQSEKKPEQKKRVSKFTDKVNIKYYRFSIKL